MNQGSDHSFPSYIRHTPSVQASFAEPVQNVYASENPRAATLINQNGHNNDNTSLLQSRPLPFPRINESNDCSSLPSYGNSHVQNEGSRLFPDTSLVESLPPLTRTYGTSNSYPHNHLSPIEILQPNATLRSGVPESPRPRVPPVSGDFPRVYSHLTPTADSGCRFPVLNPLLPYIKSIICTKDACDLLDLYFTEPSTSLFECASPYVLTQIFRKGSFLRSIEPRTTSPSLLAAMLWATAQTSDAKIFKADAFARPRICDQLYRVCTNFLSAAEHETEGWKSSRFLNYIMKHWEILSSLLFVLASISTYGGNDSRITRTSGSSNEANTVTGSKVSELDDILTYMLLGTVISGGDSKRDCLKWWTKAWSKARSLNLNREQDTDPDLLSEGPHGRHFWGPTDSSLKSKILAREEELEERRRVWWLLYIIDRHLALSYNSPLNILDAECQVYQPLEETAWQDFDPFTCEQIHRFIGPSTRITGVGLFEYFLPLMAILGDIVDIHHRTCHPRLMGLDIKGAILAVEISLEAYETSLREFEGDDNFNLPDNGQSVYPSSQNIFNTQNIIQPLSAEQARKKTVVSYSKHLLHVLHVLLHGNWDPMSMLDDPDRWVTPNSFVKCAQHAILAASAVSDILKFDPELSFMPYLFGIYLMHGSFVLLIFADKMEMTASEIVVQACETLIRAHEVCVTTLNTEYQVSITHHISLIFNLMGDPDLIIWKRNFRKVLRSALCHLKGTMVMDIEQHATRRREFLSLYKWTRDGTGLAV